ncbi:MAG: ubiquinol-cytochrome c reductase iron-sulfur subunit [Methylophilus sp.]|jgi:ubiquinol-cytochrome c reductase iron-sulfur subunit
MSDTNNGKSSGLSFQQPSEVDLEKRKFLINATAATGAVGVAAVAVPFVGSMLPSERAKAAGAPVEVDVSKLEPGSMMTTEWRGQPVWIINRTEEMLAKLDNHVDQLSDPNLEVPQQPDYCKNKGRAIKEKYAVMLGTCTHLGCSPNPSFAVTPDWDGGFVCPCHGSKFDLAGRVFKGSPAPTNLVVPAYQYLTETTILIGEDKKAEA